MPLHDYPAILCEMGGTQPPRGPTPWAYILAPSLPPSSAEGGGLVLPISLSPVPSPEPPTGLPGIWTLEQATGPGTPVRCPGARQSLASTTPASPGPERQAVGGGSLPPSGSPWSPRDGACSWSACRCQQPAALQGAWGPGSPVGEGAAGCLGVGMAAGSWVAAAVWFSPSCPGPGSAPGSACPCSSVSLQLWFWEALAGGRRLGGRGGRRLGLRVGRGAVHRTETLYCP